MKVCDLAAKNPHSGTASDLKANNPFFVGTVHLPEQAAAGHDFIARLDGFEPRLTLLFLAALGQKDQKEEDCSNNAEENELVQTTARGLSQEQSRVEERDVGGREKRSGHRKSVCGASVDEIGGRLTAASWEGLQRDPLEAAHFTHSQGARDRDP